ncbi:MAG: TIR domain-containing protein [Thiolinea sp.]
MPRAYLGSPQNQGNTMRKPRLFIASSSESIAIAEAVNVNLDKELEVTIWKNGTFKLSSSIIDDLIEKSSSVDFALFIFTPDDIAQIRSRQEHVVRDNVLFEMGLFIGSIGKERSFILKPRGIEMHLPTDLLGVTPADYETSRSDGDLVSATNRACSLIKAEVERLGLINFVGLSESRKLRTNPIQYTITDYDLKFLSCCLQSHTSYPEGLDFRDISNDLKGIKNDILRISSIKLERMGLISKSVETNNQYGHDYYAYSITELGIDTLLKQEIRLGSQESNMPDDFDDDIPF